MLPWIRHLLLLLLVAHTISANKTDEGVDLVEYYKKNKEVSPLEILLQDDKFLRENAEKHGYINGEWAALLPDSTTTTPCSKNPRLNNPDCIKNEKHSYISSPDDSRNTQKYEDKYNYDGPRVSPALAHTDRYILGKRTKENFRQELDTTIDRNIIATERGTEIEPAQNVDDKTQKKDDRITTENTLENEDEINYFTIEQNKPLHELDRAEPYNQLTQKVPFYWKEPMQTEYGQPNHVPSHGSPSQADQLEYTQNSKLTSPSNSVYGSNMQNHHHLKSMQPSNDSLGDSIPQDKKTNHALLHRINKKLPDQDTQSNSQSHATPKLYGNENAPFSGKDNVNSNIHKEQTHSNTDSSSEDTNRPNNTAPLTREQYGTIGSTVNRNFDDLGNVSSEHDSSGPPELKTTDSEETTINTAMENEINGEVANSNVTFSTKGNSADPYGRVDNNSISSADANQRNHHSSNAPEGTDMNESKSSHMKLPTKRPHTYADLYGRPDSENINNDSSQKHNDISFATERTSDEPVNYYNVSTNYSNKNNTSSKNEEQRYENISQIIKPKSDTVDVYDVGNKSDKSLAHPSSANGVVVESRQNKTPQNQMVESHNVQSETGAYGLVERTSLNTQNTTRKGDFFPPANNESFSDRNQQFQKPESTEIIEKTHTQNATGPYGLTDSTNNVNKLKENGVSSSEIPPDDAVQAYSNETLVPQKQNETNPYGLVDPVTVGSNNDNQENSFNPFTTKPSLDTQLHQETGSKTFTNPELGPYGLVDTESVSTNLKPEETRNILSGVDASSIEPAYKKFNNSLNLNYQNISIPQQNVSNEISNKTKDALQNGKKIGPYVAGTVMSEPILNNSENNDEELSQGEVNPTIGAAEPTFKILHHAKVGNYTSKQPKVLEDTIPKVISENGTNIWASPDRDKKQSPDIIKNNASKTENADAENKRTPVSYTADEAQPNRTLFILESPVQLCYCDSGKPVKGFRLIPF